MNTDIDHALAELWHKLIDTKGSLEIARLLDSELRPILVAGKAMRLQLDNVSGLEYGCASAATWDIAIKRLSAQKHVEPSK